MAKEKEIAKEAENASRPEAIETKKTEPKACLLYTSNLISDFGHDNHIT